MPRAVKAAPQFQVTWAYPNTYDVGITGLGYQLIWYLMEQDERVRVLRAFSDCQEAGYESSELFGFTLSWELDYGNVLRMLTSCAVPLLAADRETQHPLVFAGGPAIAANPESFADFFDVILVGDAEVMVPALFDKWSEIRHLKSRKEQLLQLAGVPGMYVPSLYEYELTDPLGPLKAVRPRQSGVPEFVTRQMFAAPPDYVAHSVLLSPRSAFGDMFLVEVVRSCPQECRFCLASYLTRPFRGANIDTLMERIDLGLAHTKKIGLLGPSVTEHSQFDELARRLLEKPEIQISVASIRVDTIEPHILKMLTTLGQKSVTIALESGSERLRSIMKKNLSEQQILQAMEMIADSGLKAVKLYGIAGLPGETDEDLQETVRLLTLLKKKHKQLRITFGISSFVPKAQTPFQWAARDRNCGKKLEYLRKNLAKTGIDVRTESHNWSDIQTLLSRGDRRLTKMLLSIADSTGNLGAWKKALKAESSSCPNLDYFAFRNIPYEETLPWSHLVGDVREKILLRHSTEAEKAILS